MTTLSWQKPATVGPCPRGLAMAAWLLPLIACQVDNPAYFIGPLQTDAAKPADLAAAGGAVGGSGAAGGSGGSGAVSGAGAVGGSGPVDASIDVAARDGSVPVDVPMLMSKDANPVGSGCPNDVDLVLCLRFEGNVVDESIHGLAVKLQNGAFVAGADGVALQMTGSTILQVAEAAPLKVGQFTMEISINPNRLPNNGVRLGLLERAPDFGLFLLPTGGIACKVNGVEAVSATVVQAGQWSRVACTYDLTGIRLFIAGSVDAGRAYQAPIAGLALSGIAIGAVGSSNAKPFVGLIDNVRVWGRALGVGEL